MVTKGIFKFDKNTVLDESAIRELHEFLLKYCVDVKYKAKSKDGKSHEFRSCAELLAYDNFKKEKIVELEATGYDKHESVFTLDFYGKRHSVPYIECRYNFSNPDDETLFLSHLNKFFDKRVECYNHHLVSSIIIGAALLVLSLFLAVKYKMDTRTICALVFFGVVAYYLIENKILKVLFPPVVFCWGSEIKVHQFRTSLRNNLFWAVIVSVILSLILKLF